MTQSTRHVPFIRHFCTCCFYLPVRVVYRYQRLVTATCKKKLEFFGNCVPSNFCACRTCSILVQFLQFKISNPAENSAQGHGMQAIAYQGISPLKELFWCANTLLFGIFHNLCTL